MWQNARDAYLEERILSAEPLELVRLLYHAALGAVRDARRYLAEGKIRERSRSITKASGVFIELAGCLDYEKGGDLSPRLAQLYDYMQCKLTEAHFQQADAPLAEVLGLLTTLSEAWEGIGEPQPKRAPAPPRDEWATPSYQEPVGAYASQGWSL